MGPNNDNNLQLAEGSASKYDVVRSFDMNVAFDPNSIQIQDARQKRTDSSWAAPDSASHGKQLKRKKVFTCSHCGYATDRRNNLARHVATMHDTCKQLLECCGVRFQSKALFRRHVHDHHKQGYGCAICGHNFHRKALLKRHLSIHSGHKEFTCSECNYSTSHKSNLERHRKVHQKVRPGRDTAPSSKNASTKQLPPSGTEEVVTVPCRSDLPLKKRRIWEVPESANGRLHDMQAVEVQRPESDQGQPLALIVMSEPNRPNSEAPAQMHAISDRARVHGNKLMSPWHIWEMPEAASGEVPEKPAVLVQRPESGQLQPLQDLNFGSEQKWPNSEIPVQQNTISDHARVHADKLTSPPLAHSPPGWQPHPMSITPMWMALETTCRPCSNSCSKSLFAASSGHYQGYDMDGVSGRTGRIHCTQAEHAGPAVIPSATMEWDARNGFDGDGRPACATCVQRVPREKTYRIMELPYKCFKCNLRFSSQRELTAHLQATHPVSDILTLSIVTVLNNMNKVKSSDAHGMQQLESHREQLGQFMEF